MSIGPARRYSPRLLALFARYLRGYFGRNFHALRIDRGGLPPPITAPTLFYSNHPSWWDPIILLLIVRTYYAGRRVFAPIDSAALERYPWLERFGFFGIRPGTPAGARAFLATCRGLLAEQHCIALTVQGRFMDARDRPLELKRGLARLLAALPEAGATPVALEYPFWNERRPEALIRFGPERIGAHGRGIDAVHDALAAALERNMDALAAAATARDPARFETVLSGSRGVGVWQDLPRHALAWLKCRRFDPAHDAIGRQRH